ncbi:putative ribosome biogenesis protein RLP24 [Cucumispora dikerogammari]|nr:putative ribosome biogenesis protein RLP24 [Cucumispora dikerogammari]
MRINSCHFCSAPVYPGHGRTLIRDDTIKFDFCRSKCEKLFKSKKNPRKTRWTKAYRLFHNKETANVLPNSITNLIKKKAVIEKYNRELYEKTTKAIDLLNKIRENKQNRFIKNRILAEKETQKQNELNLFLKHDKLSMNLGLITYKKLIKSDLINNKEEKIIQQEDEVENIVF